MTEKELIEKCQQVLCRIEEYLTLSPFDQAEMNEDGSLDYDVRQAIRLIDQYQYREAKNAKNE